MYFMKKRWHMFLIMLVFTSSVVDADDSAIEISVKSDELKKMLQDIKESGEPMSISELAPPKIPDSGNAALPLEKVSALVEKLGTTNKTGQNDLSIRPIYVSERAFGLVMFQLLRLKKLSYRALLDISSAGMENATGKPRWYEWFLQPVRTKSMTAGFMMVKRTQRKMTEALGSTGNGFLS